MWYKAWFHSVMLPPNADIFLINKTTVFVIEGVEIMNKIAVLGTALALMAGILSGCAGTAADTSASASASAASESASQSAAETSASASATPAATPAPVASSDTVGVGSSDAVGVGSSDAAGVGSSDAAGVGSSDAASSDSRSSEPVLSGPAGLTELNVPMKYISAADVLAAVEKNDKTKVIVDLRKPEDVKAGYIAGSIFAPLNKVVDNNNYADGIANLTSALSDATGNEVGEGKDIILVCYKGIKYAQAGTDILNALGADMDHVFTLEGGMTAWTEAKNPTVTR